MRYQVKYDFIGYQKSMNYSDSCIIHAANESEVKIKFFNKYNKDHFFIKEIRKMEE